MLRKQAHCATGYRRRQQAQRDARGTPQRVKCARALPTATTALPPAAARTFGFVLNPKRGAAVQGTQQHGALTGLVGLSPTPCCRVAGFVPRCRTEFESTVLPGFFYDHSISCYVAGSCYSLSGRGSMELSARGNIFQCFLVFRIL